MVASGQRLTGELALVEVFILWPRELQVLEQAKLRLLVEQLSQQVVQVELK